MTDIKNMTAPETEADKLAREKGIPLEDAWKTIQERKERESVKKGWDEQDKKKTKAKTKKKATSKKKAQKKQKTQKTPTPEEIDRSKDILDKYLPVIIRKDRIFLRKDKDGNDVAQVNSTNPEKYEPKNYSTDIVLQIAPKDAIIMEYEDKPEKNQRYIAETEEACRALEYQCCVTSHKGKSDYIRIYNLKGIPVNYDNKLAKYLLLDSILPPGAKQQLDKTNLMWTFSPVIGHPHWKPKYNGEIHRILRGKHPLDQVLNTYPKGLIKKINDAKKITKRNVTDTIKTNFWVVDFLTKYCTENLLPGGDRHHVIEKNLCALIFHREDRYQIIEKYLQIQQRGYDSTVTWMNAIANGEYNQVSVLELKRYIQENNINFDLSKYGKAEPKQDMSIREKAIEELKNPALLENIVDEVHKEGIVGEEPNIISSEIIQNIRFVKNAAPTSSNHVVTGKPGFGKDKLIDALNTVTVKKEDLVEASGTSPKVLDYWTQSDEYKDWDWDGKVLKLTDPSVETINSDSVRAFASGKKEGHTVVDQQHVKLGIKGKPAFTITSYQSLLDVEGTRRWEFLHADEDEQTTRAVVIDKCRKRAKAKKEINKNEALRFGLQNELKRYNVVIPFEEIISKTFPMNTEDVRTKIDAFLDYIASSAVLHQHQREKDEQGEIIATLFDYNVAVFVFRVLKGETGGSMNDREQRIVQYLTKYGKSTIRDIEAGTGIGRDWIYDNKGKMIEKKLVQPGVTQIDIGVTHRDVDTLDAIAKIYDPVSYIIRRNERLWAIVGRQWVDIGTIVGDGFDKENIKIRNNDVSGFFLKLAENINKKRVEPRDGVTLNSFAFLYDCLSQFPTDATDVSKKEGILREEIDEKTPSDYRATDVPNPPYRRADNRDASMIIDVNEHRDMSIDINDHRKPAQDDPIDNHTSNEPIIDPNDGLNKDTVLPQVVANMLTKPATDWSINDIAMSLGYASLDMRKKLCVLLENESRDPGSKYGIRQADESGLYWRVANEKKETNE